MVANVSLRSLRMQWPTTKSHCKQTTGTVYCQKKEDDGDANITSAAHGRASL